MIPQVQFDDAAARERIRCSLDESLIVEASAGTGKTSELVRRIVRVLQTGASPIDKIVAVTFTHKAAGELKLRLRQGLDEARSTASDAREIRNLEDALEHLEEASIGTIHSFCAQILRQRPVEAVVDPAFEEIPEQEAARLYERAFRGWMQQMLGEPSPGLRRALVRLAWKDSFDERSPMGQLQEAGRRLVEWRDFPAPWRRPPFEREREIDALLRKVSELAELSGRARRITDNLYRSLAPARELAAAQRGDYDTVEARLLKLQRDLNRNFRKGAGFFGEGVPREQVVSLNDEVLHSIEEFRVRADADLAALLRAEMQTLIERYDELKRRSGKLDFVDLLILVRDLVRGKAEVRRYLQKRFERIFVDEFQDTDPLQAEILLLLAAGDPEQDNWREAAPARGKLFVVGDPKQSIYKFRRADVALYQEIRERLVERGVGLLYLTKSFRAVRPIQTCINAAFEREMTGEAGQAKYAPLEEHWQPTGEQPCMIALPAPRPYATRRIAKSAINACLPDTVVAFIEWLIRESGWQVRELEHPGEWVAISARHICILFRRFTNWGVDLTRDYVRSLEARGIAHLLVGSKSFHRREEVETLRAALNAVEWPDDELSVFATLKGSLFAIPDSTLLRFRHEIGRLHPFHRFPEKLDEEFQPVTEALRLLADLHRGRNRRPVADTVNLLLEATRAHAGFALRPAGHQVLANVYRVADLARSFEVTGGISFRGFVEELEAQAEKAESAEAPVLEEGADGVRLMTVHTAKGLEFPVVILADMTANLAATDPEKHVDAARGLCAVRLLRCAPAELVEHEPEEKARELAEGVRVAYVAATRARDLLVVPVVGDEERDGWVSPLNKAIYPPKENYRNSTRARGCPQFGETSVLERPADFFGQSEFSVKPGLHRPREGTHKVVWWDPKALKLTVEANFGLRQEEVLAGGSEEGLRQYEQWDSHREETLQKGGRLALDVFTASESVEAPAGFECPIEVESVVRPPGRPAGRRFGTLVHEVLRDIDLSGDRDSVASMARMHGRLLGASAEEIDAAVEAVSAALAHPLLDRARSAERCHRELPVMLKLDANKLLEGAIDLAFLERGTWIILDFKTDADLPARQAHYRRQLLWYGLALAQTSRLPVRAWLLSV